MDVFPAPSLSLSHPLPTFFRGLIMFPDCP